MTFYREMYDKRIIRQADYSQITHFTASDKYVTAYTDDGRELVITDTLKALRSYHPELVHIHRATLVKPELIARFWRDSRCDAYQVGMKDGKIFQVSRHYYKSIRALIDARKELQA